MSIIDTLIKIGTKIFLDDLCSAELCWISLLLQFDNLSAEHVQSVVR